MIHGLPSPWFEKMIGNRTDSPEFAGEMIVKCG